VKTLTQCHLLVNSGKDVYRIPPVLLVAVPLLKSESKMMRQCKLPQNHGFDRLLCYLLIRLCMKYTRMTPELEGKDKTSYDGHGFTCYHLVLYYFLANQNIPKDRRVRRERLRAPPRMEPRLPGTDGI